MKRLTILFASVVLLTVSCQVIFDDIKESITTVTAKYIETQAGIEIKDFKKDAKLEKAGLVDENGNIPERFTFNKPDSYDIGGILSCNELPFEFIKISNRPWWREVAPSKYVGTWEAIVPLPQGFRKIFLDLNVDGKCSIYFDISPKSNVEIKTHTETVLKGNYTSENGFVLSNITSSKGYAKTIKRFAGWLQELQNSHNFLVANFKVYGAPNKVKLLELLKEDSTKKTYIGTGDFAKEKVGTEITFEIDGNNFILTIPEGTVFPKNFSK